ncbi:hypothetical protein [Streptomyces noursei]|uniref:hypothetical protein n=1 Tax=Streptomyces noursei TaxID=1971 RepID=UPI0037F484BE
MLISTLGSRGRVNSRPRELLDTGQRGQLASGPGAEVGRGAGQEGELTQPHDRLGQLDTFIKPFSLDRLDGGPGVGCQTLRGGGVGIRRGRVGGTQEDAERVVVLGVLVGEVEQPLDGRGRWRHVEKQGFGGRLGHERRRAVGPG